MKLENDSLKEEIIDLNTVLKELESNKMSDSEAVISNLQVNVINLL